MMSRFFTIFLFFITSHIISFGQNPTCPDPTGPNTSNITTSSATVSWTSTAGASAIEYGLSGFSIGAGTTVNPLTNPYILTNLVDNTTYDYYIRDICAPGDTSNWIGPYSFTTLACSILIAPFLDDIESHTQTFNLANSQCWSTSSTPSLSGPYWGVDGNGSTFSPNTGPSGANSGSNYFYFESTLGIQGDFADLYSPSIDISGLTTPSLAFAYHMYGVTVDTLEVSINDGTGWTEVFQIHGQQQTADSLPWIPEFISLMGYTGVIQARFRGYKGSWFTGDIAIDDIGFVNCITDTTVTIVSCDSVISASGTTYSSSGIYIDSVLNMGGCGAVITYNITINDNTVSQVNANTLSSNQSGATYQWLDCDNGYAPILGATNQSFVATNNGNYAVAVSYMGCVDTSACTTISSVGLPNNETTFASIFPNPFQNYLTIVLSDLDNAQFELLDLQGKVVISSTAISNGQKVDVSNLESGIYFVRLTSADNRMVKRIVKY